jgi:Fur family zinc uptake transcriptional regulator
MDQHSPRDVETQLEAAADACHRNGAQFTELRRAVLGLILDAEGPSTAYQLLDRLKKIRKGAVPPTVYRALDFLMEQGLIHRIERLNAFIPCTQGDHSHHAVQFLICRNCGAVAEIEDPAISGALERAAARAGFQPRMATVEVDGLCAACAAAAERQSRPPA